MEKASSSSSYNTLSSNFLDLIFLHVIFDLKHNLSNFFMSSWSLFHAKFHFFNSSEAIMFEPKSNNIIVRKQSLISSNNVSIDHDDDCLFGCDINMIMERLGIQHSFEGEELQKKWDCKELSNLFEDEPSLEEVKEAFDVFDQNKDGFIDAGELQRVLCVLGIRKGVELQDCRKMIKGFDQNNDGKIDFNEFVGFMLKTFN
ncbi:probable calcium-binding protein CML45 [Chenopodium quinoa]|uniref:probable calcium-binding protein CML45 n=1 Tax=Chenopodium quinoa TaxID=63459 RepID=UPI000B7931DA|nr:probable calcium-binding protein CML45 [Chenopodium quinoa]XP_021765864.1 probable calcium-binding protein CML45 [Chenopodium quinoa]XP_021765866.1 probable calcium-binding protein CML45 [Chenopodium quinoa]